MAPKPIPFKLKCNDNYFNTDELHCLQQYGHQLQSLLILHMPTNREEEEFLLQARKLNESDPHSITKSMLKNPTTGKYKVFLKYVAILASEGKPFELKPNTITPVKRSTIESRTKGGFSTDDQENRYDKPKPLTDEWPRSGGF